MKNPIAESNHYNSFDFTKPKDADENKEYFCPDPECSDPNKRLFLRKSSQNKKYFAHKIGNEHEVNPKTLLHKILVGHFKNMDTYQLPKEINGKKEIKIDREKSVVDFKGLHGDVPDILLVDQDGFQCFVDVTIGHKIDKKKMEAVKYLKSPFVEIDLQKIYEEHEERLKKNIDYFFDHADEWIKSSGKLIYLPEDKKGEKKPMIRNTSTIIGGAVLLGAAGLATYLSIRAAKK